ncbi:11038_t:CDS:2 [Cetraspora pellucida]|uniref:11038_t:CDS:1 n=1 Tax=Cetraspora pellucida TaxID=1433469 RepID=A0ACA9NQM7_9GLOM|nr:11038_t:CDS:2 [Cetraspora pellucida]
MSNITEGVLSMFFGQQTRSVSLIIFGIASFVETASSILVLWRFVMEIRQNIVKEQKLIEYERKGTLGIGSLFIILAFGTLSHSIITLTQKNHPENTTAAIKLNSSTMLYDAQCSLACIKITAVLFCSSLIYLIWAKLWWIDSAAALIFGIFFAKEGIEMITHAKDKNFNGGYSISIDTNSEIQSKSCKPDEMNETSTTNEKGRHLRVSANDDDEQVEESAIIGAWWRENGTDIELENMALKSIKNETETSFPIAIVAH